METVIERTTSKEQKIAQDNLPKVQRLATSFAKRSEPVSVQVNDHDIVTLNLPAKLFSVLQSILDLMAKGKAFSLIPGESEISTQQAADMLNVSRPYVVKLLERGDIPFSKIGTHRRIKFEDLMAYAEKMKADRKKGLQELATQAQKLNMGY